MSIVESPHRCPYKAYIYAMSTSTMKASYVVCLLIVGYLLISSLVAKLLSKLITLQSKSVEGIQITTI